MERASSGRDLEEARGKFRRRVRGRAIVHLTGPTTRACAWFPFRDIIKPDRFAVDERAQMRVNLRVRARAGMDQHCGTPSEGR